MHAFRKTCRKAWVRVTFKSAIADILAQVISGAFGKGVGYRIARSSEEYRNLEQALRSSDEQLRAIAPLQDLSELHRLLRDHRPDNLHVNGCGDFQLMAREHWNDLRAYPEFETFSMNIEAASILALLAGSCRRVYSPSTSSSMTAMPAA